MGEREEEWEANPHSRGSIDHHRYKHRAEYSQLVMAIISCTYRAGIYWGISGPGAYRSFP